MRKVVNGLVSTSIGLLTMGVGIFTLIDRTLPARLGEASIPLTRKTSIFVGVVVVLCGLWFLYFGIKNFLKSRRP